MSQLPSSPPAAPPSQRPLLLPAPPEQQVARVSFLPPEFHKELRQGLWAGALDFYDRMDRTRTFGLAAEMAFWLFLALIPLATVAGMVAAKVAAEHRGTVSSVLASLPPTTVSLISHELNQIAAWKGGRVAGPAVVVFVWLASSGFHATFEMLELQYDARVRRRWWKKRAYSIFACVLLSAGVAVVTLLGTGLEWTTDLVGRRLPFLEWTDESTFLGRLSRLSLGAAVAVSMVTGVYWLGVPASARHGTPLLPGALFAVSLHTILGFGYAFYISKMGDGGAYQAGLSAIAVTLMTLYFFSCALLVGAEINQMIGEKHLPADVVAHEANAPRRSCD